MALVDILNEKIIDLDIEAENKDEALHHLSKLLKEQNYIDDIDIFVKDIYERESEGKTGIGNSIAIPHGKSSSVKNIGIAIGRTKNPIDWESIDDKPISLIFLFCVSDNNDYARNHLLLLAEIAGKLGNDEQVEKLRKATNKEEIVSILCE